jgi:2,3-bisphosphoglycerate-dependent phosphoglycerate mutase
MTATRFCIIRHGETDWNVERRIQGHADVPLNSMGEAQAAAAAAGLAGQPFAAAYSSDLDRAWRTAQTAVQPLGLIVQAESGLRERHYGVLQGLTSAEIRERLPQVHARYVARDVHYDFETGESLSDFAKRVVATVEQLARRHQGASVLLVSHGGVLDICHRHATGRPLSTPRDFQIPNAALNWFELDAGGWRLLAWADRRHLDRALEESVE